MVSQAWSGTDMLVFGNTHQVGQIDYFPALYSVVVVVVVIVVVVVAVVVVIVVVVIVAVVVGAVVVVVVSLGDLFLWGFSDFHLSSEGDGDQETQKGQDLGEHC